MKKYWLLLIMLLFIQCERGIKIEGEYDPYKEMEHIWMKFQYRNSYITFHKYIKNNVFAGGFAAFGVDLSLHASEPDNILYLKIDDEVIKIMMHDLGSEKISDNYAYTDIRGGFHAGSNSRTNIQGKFSIDKKLYDKLAKATAFEIRFYLGKYRQSHWTFNFYEEEVKKIAFFSQLNKAEKIKK